jgi:hypothetical protein
VPIEPLEGEPGQEACIAETGDDAVSAVIGAEEGNGYLLGSEDSVLGYGQQDGDVSVCEIGEESGGRGLSNGDLRPAFVLGIGAVSK